MCGLEEMHIFQLIQCKVLIPLTSSEHGVSHQYLVNSEAFMYVPHVYRCRWFVHGCRLVHGKFGRTTCILYQPHTTYRLVALFSFVAGVLQMIDPQKTPFIAHVQKEYHIYDSPDGEARCGEKPASFESTMNRSWRPELKHLIQMDGQQEIHDKIYYTPKQPSTPIPMCISCSATAQSKSPLWHKILQLPFEKSPDSLIQSGHDVRLIQMPKGSLIGWVEHKTKPKRYENEGYTAPSSLHRSRYGGSWRSSGYTVSPSSGWTKTRVWKSTMYVSKDRHEVLVRELFTRAENTTADEASVFFYPAEDILFMAQYTDGKYKYAGAWTFAKPTFPVKQMEFDEFISTGYWMPASYDLADEEFKLCPGCGETCGLESLPSTTLQNHRCLSCKWSTIQPSKVDLIPIEE